MTETISEQQLSPNYVVDVAKPSHLTWWAAAFDVPEQAVIEAVEVVGPQAIKVFFYLQRDRARAADRIAPHRSSDRRHSDRREADRRAPALGFLEEVVAEEAHHGSGQR